MTFSKPRPGIAFKDGKLCVFSKCRVSVLKGWPEMAAWTRSNNRPKWQRFRPAIDIAKQQIGSTRSQHRSPLTMRWWPQRVEEAAWRIPPDQLAEAQEAMAPDRADEYEEDGWCRFYRRRIAAEKQIISDFIATIPKQVRDVVARFPSRHWHLLSMVARCDSTLQFLQENPGLGVAMASCWVFSNAKSGQAMRWIRRMAPRRRRDIVAALGFPKSEAAVRVLAKLKPDSCSVSNILLLRDFLEAPDFKKLLAHAPLIDNTLLTLMSFAPLQTAITRRFVSHVALEENSATCREMLPGMLWDYLRMLKLLGIKEGRRFQTVDSLVVAHDLLARRVLEKVHTDRKDIKFPEPPVRGCDGITPICNVAELCEEARVQRNCVASLAWDVAARSLFVYRMHKPERATIALRHEGDVWTLSEVSAACNQPVSSQALMAIGDWLGIEIPF